MPVLVGGVELADDATDQEGEEAEEPSLGGRPAQRQFIPKEGQEGQSRLRRGIRRRCEGFLHLFTRIEVRRVPLCLATDDEAFANI